MEKIIFFGNGRLSDTVLSVLIKNPDFKIIFHAREKSDLETVKKLKKADPAVHGILASFGVLIKSDVLDLFEPEGILNIHPSKLPLYRGASPIESAILNGDKDFYVSIMKLVKGMDAGPLYAQLKVKASDFSTDFPDKFEIYDKLAAAGAGWIVCNLKKLPAPAAQDGSKATFTSKFDTSMSELKPAEHTAIELLDQIRAFAGFPKSRYQIFGIDTEVRKAHLATSQEAELLGAAAEKDCVVCTKKLLALHAADGLLVIDEVQPASKKVMDAKSFLNGYRK